MSQIVKSKNFMSYKKIKKKTSELRDQTSSEGCLLTRPPARWTNKDVPHLPHAVELQGQGPEVVLAHQRVDLILDVAHKLLPGYQLVRSTQLPPGRQRGQETLGQLGHRTAVLRTGETRR